MENPPEDQKVVDLLTKLRDSNGAYPSDMLAARRRTYLRQMANIGLGIGIGAGLGHAAKGGGNGAGVATSTVASKILETILVAVIVIEAGTVAYLYREKIAYAVRSYLGAPAVQEVASPSDETSGSVPEIEAIGTPLVTVSETPSATPSGTPASEVAGEDNQKNNNGLNSGVSVDATPDPENQGNQYGLTPKPERTKENNAGSNNTNPNNNSGGGGGGGNNGGGGGSSNNGNGGGNNGP